jgi:hypothetical protein
MQEEFLMAVNKRNDVVRHFMPHSSTLTPPDAGTVSWLYAQLCVAENAMS